MNQTEHEKVSKARADLDAAEDYINSLDLAPNLVHRLRSGIAALDELLVQPVEPPAEPKKHGQVIAGLQHYAATPQPPKQGCYRNDAGGSCSNDATGSTAPVSKQGDAK